jgi:hypothetical protein
LKPKPNAIGCGLQPFPPETLRFTAALPDGWILAGRFPDETPLIRDIGNRGVR